MNNVWCGRRRANGEDSEGERGSSHITRVENVTRAEGAKKREREREKQTDTMRERYGNGACEPKEKRMKTEPTSGWSVVELLQVGRGRERQRVFTFFILRIFSQLDAFSVN